MNVQASSQAPRFVFGDYVALLLPYETPDLIDLDI